MTLDDLERPIRILAEKMRFMKPPHQKKTHCPGFGGTESAPVFFRAPPNCEICGDGGGLTVSWN